MGKWLILEPYVYISISSCEGVVYNTLNHKIYETENKDILKILIKLKKIKNSYIVSINDKMISLEEVNLFIKWLKTTYSGDLITNKIAKVRPVQIAPNIYLKQSSYEFKNPEFVYYNEVNQTLHELIFFINGKCQSNCNICEEAYKQTIFCRKGQDTELSITLIDNILVQLRNTSLTKINISGGNIFNYSEIDELIQLISKTTYSIIFHVNIKNIKNTTFIQRLICINSIIHIKVIINEITNDDLYQIKAIGNLYSNNIQFDFIVQSEDDYNYIHTENLNINNYNIIPFFNKKNICFFEKNIFLTKRDIKSTKKSMIDIFRGQVFNLHFLGKLIINNDGSVLSSVNLPPLGRIDLTDDFSSILIKAVGYKSTWRLLRKSASPCKSCRFNFLCPPISDYELVIGKKDLCHVNRSK